MNDIIENSKSDSTGLTWVCLKQDNFLMNSLKQMAGTFAQVIKKEAEKAENDIKEAKKVFYG